MGIAFFSSVYASALGVDTLSIGLWQYRMKRHFFYYLFAWYQYNLNFFLTSTEAPALRRGYVYSQHAEHALCRLESSC